MQFIVWAPKANEVAVRVDNGIHGMSGPDMHGCWQAEVEHDANVPASYGFLLNGNQNPLPDPRSRRQPNGVHALSSTYDQAAFPWTDSSFRAAPLASAVIYELHIGTFSPEGTFDGAIARLDHLVELGVTHVELMPVASFEGVHGWGYDGVSLFAPHEPYGGPDGLKRFVDACHAHCLAVLLDVVYNHFGPSGNYTGQFGPYINNSHATPWGGAINFEAAGAHQVRRFFIDNALMWLRDYHIDGLRLDAVHEFVDRSAIHFLEQLAIEVADVSATIGKPCVLIAESDLNDPRLVASREAHGFGLDAQWSDDFHHALHSLLTGERSGYYEDFGSVGQLAKALQSVYVFDGIYSPHRRRAHGRPIGSVSLHHFLAYLQNHDQVGNRACGERMCHLVPFRRAQVGAAIVFASAFVPMIFQGEEWAASTPFQYFADHTDDDLRSSVTNGRVSEFSAFGWKPEEVPDPESHETFMRSKLNWAEVNQGEHAEMLDWYRRLIDLRRHTEALNRGDAGSLGVQCDEEAKTLQISRGNVLILVNLSTGEQEFACDQNAQILIGNFDPSMANGTVALPPDSVLFLSLPPG